MLVSSLIWHVYLRDGFCVAISKREVYLFAHIYAEYSGTVEIITVPVVCHPGLLSTRSESMP